MLSSRLTSGKESPAARPNIADVELEMPAIAGVELKVPVLAELMDTLDLHSFFHDPTCRRTLNEVLEAFSDEEFDRFECFYTSRLTLN